VVKQLNPGAGENEQTEWSMIGTIPYGGNTLVGQWRSSIPDTKRYGCAVLKFIDNGRAIGYWTGPSRRDYPVYGYWVMARHKSDVEQLGEEILKKTHFKWIDAIGPLLSGKFWQEKGHASLT
jgi:hypothetical protein